MKRILFLIGVACLALTFLTTSAELAARIVLGAQNGGVGLWVSTLTVWKTVAASSLYALMNSALWPYAQPLLNLPGWLLFGVPGLMLSVTFRPPADDGAEPLATKAQVQAHEESLFLYDELARAAHAEGYTSTQDDRDPSAFGDTVPAESHFADEILEDQLLPERDYLLGPPARKSQHKPDDDTAA